MELALLTFFDMWSSNFNSWSIVTPRSVSSNTWSNSSSYSSYRWLCTMFSILPSVRTWHLCALNWSNHFWTNLRELSDPVEVWRYLQLKLYAGGSWYRLQKGMSQSWYCRGDRWCRLRRVAVLGCFPTVFRSAQVLKRILRHWPSRLAYDSWGKLLSIWEYSHWCRRISVFRAVLILPNM